MIKKGDKVKILTGKDKKKEGDVIEMSIEGLGNISNKIIKDNSNYQIK